MYFFNYLLNRKKNLFTPIAPKTACLKNFVKAMDRNSDAFLFLKDISKNQKSIFVGPQIKVLIKDRIIKKFMGNSSLRITGSMTVNFFKSTKTRDVICF